MKNRSVRFSDMPTMPALTLRQPWAWAVLNGKDVENRGKRTNVRGSFAVHAGKQCEVFEYRIAVEWMVARGLVRSAAFPTLRPSIVALLDRWERAPILPLLEELPRGVIIGQSDLIDVIPSHLQAGQVTNTEAGVPMKVSAWKMDGKYGYQLARTRPCEHKAVDGMPGWFYVPRSYVVPIAVEAAS